MSNKKLRKTVTSDLDKPEEEEKKSERDELFDNLGSGMGLLPAVVGAMGPKGLTSIGLVKGLLGKSKGGKVGKKKTTVKKRAALRGQRSELRGS